MWMLSSQRGEKYILNYHLISKPGNLQTIFGLCQMALCWAQPTEGTIGYMKDWWMKGFLIWICFFIGEAAATSHSRNGIQFVFPTSFCFNFLCRSVPSQTLQHEYLFPLSHFFILLSSLAFSPLLLLYFSTGAIFNLYKPVRVFHISSLHTCDYDTNINVTW